MVQNFDAAWGMFREEGKPVDYRRLQFLRSLIGQGRLEHPRLAPRADRSSWRSTRG